jgi:hypothetical protein
LSPLRLFWIIVTARSAEEFWERYFCAMANLSGSLVAIAVNKALTFEFVTAASALGRAVAVIEFAMKKMLITKLDTYFNLVIFSLPVN